MIILLSESTLFIHHVAVQEGLAGIRVSWIPPLFPIMYTIRYIGTSSGIVYVRNGSTDNYLLTGLHNGASYSISISAKTIILATSPHLTNIDLRRL